MPPADMVTINIHVGKTNATPASTSGPSRPSQNASTALDVA